jgi:hypothetical protein
VRDRAPVPPPSGYFALHDARAGALDEVYTTYDRPWTFVQQVGLSDCIHRVYP